MAPRDGDRSKTFTRRAVVLGGMKLSLIGALVGRMYYLQVVESDRYVRMSEENQFNMRLLPPPRGRIVDRFGEPLAVNSQNFRVNVIGEDILSRFRTTAEREKAIVSTLDALGQILPLTDSERQKVARELKRRRGFVPVTIRENLSWEDMVRIQINKPDLPGIAIDEGLTRFYPLGDVAAHLLGYVASVSEEELTGDPLLELPGFRIGKQGVERVYDLALRGRGGTSRVEVNALGRVMAEQTTDEAQAGAEVALTIDKRLQSYAARRLGEESASAVVMDVHTGDILAMASMPAFDPNAFTRGLTSEEWRTLVENPRSPLINKSVAGQYSPGSTFKMLVSMAAQEAGLIKPNQTVFCPGHMELGGHRFHCWKRGGHGAMDMTQAIAQSCDVYFYEIARRLGIDRIADMAKKFGVGTFLDVGLTGEKPGLMPSRAWKTATLGQPWHQGETLVAGIGQGYVLSTPLQLAVMTSRIANGGLAVKPVLSRNLKAPPEEGTETGETLPSEPPPSLGVSKPALDMAKQGMWEVVNGPRGTARRSALPEELGQMAGKTGTTQVRRITMREREMGIRSQDDLPWEHRNHALFVGYAPHDAPRYAVAVVVEHGGGGSKAAAPIASDIMAETLRLDPSGVHPAGTPLVGNPNEGPGAPDEAPEGGPGGPNTPAPGNRPQAPAPNPPVEPGPEPRLASGESLSGATPISTGGNR